MARWYFSHNFIDNFVDHALFDVQQATRRPIDDLQQLRSFASGIELFCSRERLNLFQRTCLVHRIQQGLRCRNHSTDLISLVLTQLFA